MADDSPTYVLTVIKRLANPAFNPESLCPRPYGGKEFSELESRQYNETEMMVTITQAQFESLKKSLLETWC